MRTQTTDKTDRPEWNDRVTFYRKRPSEDVVVEVSVCERERERGREVGRGGV